MQEKLLTIANAPIAIFVGVTISYLDFVENTNF